MSHRGPAATSGRYGGEYELGRLAVVPLLQVGEGKGKTYKKESAAFVKERGRLVEQPTRNSLPQTPSSPPTRKQYFQSRHVCDSILGLAESTLQRSRVHGQQIASSRKRCGAIQGATQSRRQCRQTGRSLDPHSREVPVTMTKCVVPVGPPLQACHCCCVTDHITCSRCAPVLLALPRSAQRTFENISIASSRRSGTSHSSRQISSPCFSLYRDYRFRKP